MALNFQKFARSVFTKQFSSFTYLNITQFLGALNDNIFKMLIVFFLIQIWGIGESHIILSTTGAVFVLPFLLFSSNSGMLADRFSKRNIIVMTKILELVVMSVGLLAFAFGNATWSYVTLFLMATQSAIFGPSKYGIIPEIVHSDKLSSANGLLTSFTFLAIIIGTFLASFVTEITDKNFVMAALFCTLIALAGVITSFGIEYTEPSGSEKKMTPNLFKEIYSTLKVATEIPLLSWTMYGSAFFFFLGAFVQLNIIPFAVESLGISDVQGPYLFLLTALGIGTGSYLAGKISGKGVELGLTPLSGLGITLGLFAVDLFQHSLITICILMTSVGVLGGFFVLPLDTYNQVAAPNQMRGQILATSSILSFIGVLFASVLIYLLTALFGLQPHSGFSVMGLLALIVSIVYAYKLRHHSRRFVGMVFAKLTSSVTIDGDVVLTPTLFKAELNSQEEALLLFTCQRCPILFVDPKDQLKISGIYRFLIKTIPTDEIEPSLKKGFSVCLLDGKAKEAESAHLVSISRGAKEAHLTLKAC